MSYSEDLNSGEAKLTATEVANSASLGLDALKSEVLPVLLDRLEGQDINDLDEVAKLLPAFDQIESNLALLDIDKLLQNIEDLIVQKIQKEGVLGNSKHLLLALDFVLKISRFGVLQGSVQERFDTERVTQLILEKIIEESEIGGADEPVTSSRQGKALANLEFFGEAVDKLLSIAAEFADESWRLEAERLQASERGYEHQKINEQYIETLSASNAHRWEALRPWMNDTNSEGLMGSYLVAMGRLYREYEAAHGLPTLIPAIAERSLAESAVGSMGLEQPLYSEVNDETPEGSISFVVNGLELELNYAENKLRVGNDYFQMNLPVTITDAQWSPEAGLNLKFPTIFGEQSLLIDLNQIVLYRDTLKDSQEDETVFSRFPKVSLTRLA